MSSVSGFSGVYAVDWAQTAPGEEWGLAPEFLSVGMTWRWKGRARRLDAPVETLRLDSPLERSNPRLRARMRLRRMRRLALAERASVDGVSGNMALGDLALGDLALADGGVDCDPTLLADQALPGDAMTLTDGRRIYHARLIRAGQRLLTVFDRLLPPEGRILWISALRLSHEAARRVGVICFLPGTRIATPRGPRDIATLKPGEKVCTRDNGDQPVVWRGETHLSGAELYLHPALRPLRIRADFMGAGRPDRDLRVSPAHRLLMPAPGALSSAGEVLVAAEDLEDGRAVRRDFSVTSVRYVHLMFERHEIITANGVPCESFHPGLAEPRVLSWHARSLEQAVPGLAAQPSRYGDTARPCLDRGEAAILRHAMS